MPTDPAEADSLSDLEAALGALRPRPNPARDRILFEAGRAAGARPPARRRPFWPALAAGLGSIALGEAALLARRPAPAVVERIIVLREPSPAPASAIAASSPPAPEAPPAPIDRPIPPDARHRLVDQVARFGLDGLPPTPIGDDGPDRLPTLSGRDLLRREIQSALSSGG